MSITFTDGLGNSREVKLEECIPLELKLNLTRYSRKYRELGDFLYKYKTNHGYSSQLPSTKILSSEELAYLDDLYNMNYDELLKYHNANWTDDYYFD